MTYLHYYDTVGSRFPSTPGSARCGHNFDVKIPLQLSYLNWKVISGQRAFVCPHTPLSLQIINVPADKRGGVVAASGSAELMHAIGRVLLFFFICVGTSFSCEAS